MILVGRRQCGFPRRRHDFTPKATTPPPRHILLLPVTIITMMILMDLLLEQFLQPQCLVMALSLPMMSSTLPPSVTSSTSGRDRGTKTKIKIGIIGGGASGMFCAVTASSKIIEYQHNQGQNTHKDVEIHVMESTSNLMAKVKISGGGRCNVLHDTSKPIGQILNGYPRGKKELNGLFHKHFTPSDAQDWFQRHGVQLKTEKDGRMFPITDTSQTIIDCIMDCARNNNNVHFQMKRRVVCVDVHNSKYENEDGMGNTFIVTYTNDEKESYDYLVIATGSNPSGHELASKLGHRIVKPVPSLFTFNTKNQIKYGQVFHSLSGLSVQQTKITLKLRLDRHNNDPNENTKNKKKKKMKVMSQEGPLLITHHGISGPAVLRLSAFAAREFHDLNYRTDNVQIHWAPEFGTVQEIESHLWQMTSLIPKKNISTSCPLLSKNVMDKNNNRNYNYNDQDNGIHSSSLSLSSSSSSSSTIIPRRLWSSLVMLSGFESDAIWSQASKKKIGALSRNIAEFNVDVTGKGIFKEEFVTAGGINLKDITMKTMESKVCSGLYFCGEVIDVDGVTGGFNFMNCWSTGYMAGQSIVRRIIESSTEK